MKDQDTKTHSPDIELVDIEDLRTAFGGEGHDVDADAPSIAAGTTMCTGWYVEN